MTALEADPCHVVAPPAARPDITPCRMDRHHRRKHSPTNRHLLLLTAVLQVAHDLAAGMRVEGHDRPCDCCSTLEDFEECGDRAQEMVTDLCGVAWTLDVAAAAVEQHTYPLGERFRADGESYADDLAALVELADELL